MKQLNVLETLSQNSVSKTCYINQKISNRFQKLIVISGLLKKNALTYTIHQSNFLENGEERELFRPQLQVCPLTKALLTVEKKKIF